MNTYKCHIKPNPNNPRTIKDERFAKLVKSLQDFPEMLDKRPLICFTDVDGKFVVLGGNQRLKAAKEAGIKELPVLLADDWTPEQQREFVIKDNGDWYGEWDWEILQTDWDIDTLIEWGLEVPFEDEQPFEREPDVDYSILDEAKSDIDNDMQNMQNGVKKALLIEFEAEHYDGACEIVRFWRHQGLYIGGFLMEKLKEEQSKIK